jgi:glutamine amidotransferase
LSSASVVVLDYGLGNLFSVAGALQKIGAKRVEITSDKKSVQKADLLILPGVGAFGDGMSNLQERDLVGSINDFATSGRPVLGVCLGMQLLMSKSEEFGHHTGLNLVAGKARRLRPQGNGGFKVPQIGWNTLHPPTGVSHETGLWENTVLGDLNEGSFMYFLHSYVVEPDKEAVCLANTSYGGYSFCSVLKMGNVTGVQFHPERSGEEGLSIYRSFIAQV